MVLIKKKQSDTPAILLDKGAAAIEALKAMSKAERLKHKYDSAIYGGPIVKDKLKTLQNDKCCFCEGNVSALSHGDVEHYRPKAGWRQSEKEQIVKPGYYWLAYDFSNLFLSCQICNQTNKKNYFPIAEGSMRCLLHTGDLNREEPLIINPGGKLDPAKYLTFHEEMAVAINDNEIGIETIKRTGLNRKKLVKLRYEYLETLKIVALAAAENTPAGTKAKAYFKEIGKSTKIFSLMVRCNFKHLV